MLTEALVQRVFEECQTYEGEMDFKSFLDFVLAIQNRSSRPAQLYLFRILDLNKQGHIGQFEIHYFFRHIRDLLIHHGHQVRISHTHNTHTTHTHTHNTHTHTHSQHTHNTHTTHTQHTNTHTHTHTHTRARTAAGARGCVRRDFRHGQAQKWRENHL
jgi:hypothetical protein